MRIFILPILMFLVGHSTADMCTTCKLGIQQVKEVDNEIKKVVKSAWFIPVLLVAPPPLAKLLENYDKAIRIIEPFLNESTCEAVGICGRNMRFFHLMLTGSTEARTKLEANAITCKQCQFFIMSLNLKSLHQAICHTKECENALNWLIGNPNFQKWMKDPKSMCGLILRETCVGPGLDDREAYDKPTDTNDEVNDTAAFLHGILRINM